MKAGGKSADNAPEAPLPTLQVQLRQLSRTLKVPQALADTAYRNFVEVQANYVLTGSPLEWLACALYFVTPHDAVKGNHSNPAPSFMSLANFLMQFDMSFDTFMEKSEKWANMHSTNTERMIGVLQDHHRAYTVSKLIFRSFDDMFWMMFSHPNTTQDTSVDAKLQEAKNAVAKKKPPVVADSKKPPTAEEIFQFTWGLFCYVRRDEGKVKDSVLSNTLLIVCMEQMLQDIIACGHQHMLNEEFKSFPPALFEESGMVEIPELLETLCERFQGMVGEARAIKANWLQPRLAAMLEKETMRGDVSSQTGLLRAENLAWNVHGIFAMYYESNEKVHGYDELQFLRLPRRFGECKIQFDVKLRPVDVRIPKKGKSEALATIKMEKASENSMHATAQAGKGVLEALDTVFSNVSGLQKLLEGCSRAPSANLTQVFEDCDTTGEETSVQTRVDQHVRACITKFREHHSEADDMTKVENQEDLAVILYYKLLEGIVMDEKRRMTSAGIALALAQDVLHHALLAACFEIVLFCTHDTSHRFPWILTTLSLAPYNFFRIIELLIRVEPDFSRDVTSHLSKVEEQILESMAWLESSPLWDKLYPDGQRGPVPSCAEAFLPGQLEAIGRNLSAVMKKVETSDLIHLSPVPSSTTFRDPQSSKAPEEVEDEEKEEGQSEEPSKTPVVSRRATHSSVDIFFRKFYSLAFVRLNCFGELLDMKRNDLIQKTWTCFEHAIKTHTQIMRGRHMDQILMCCIYITCKATGYDVKFEEIMKCYRTQRNAASHIYRSVLIKNQGQDVPLSPVEIPPDNFQDRGDIIKFYNAVFLETMGGFAEQFCETPANQENLLLLLSPVPKLQSLTVSPRKRVSNKFRVYVSPLNPSLKPPSLSPNRIQFQLTLDQRFPPKNVQAINNYVGQTRAVSGTVSSLIKSPMKQAQKRLLTDEPAPVLAGGEKFAKKLRQAQILLPPPSD